MTMMTLITTRDDVTVLRVVAEVKWAWRFRPTCDVIDVAVNDFRNRLRDIRLFSIPVSYTHLTLPTILRV